MRGLIIKSLWIDYILAGEKPWEIRAGNTRVRGKIGLIKSGTGCIYGTAYLVDCKKLNVKLFEENRRRHRIDGAPPYKDIYAWVLESPQRYEKPVPYTHPRGAIIWVKLPDDGEAE